MKQPRISPDSLLLFYDVVNAESINKAADKLGLPKSTISRKLGELESTLGTLLVKRGNQGLLLTDAGKALYERCGRIAAEIEEASLLAGEARDDLVGGLRVSLPPDFWMSWFGDAVCDFAAQHPGIHLDLLCHDRFVDVSTEPFDLAVHIGEVRNQNLHIKRLGTIGRGFYASPGYLRHNRAPARVEDLMQHAPIMTQSQLHEHLWDVPDAGGLQSPVGRFLVNSVGFARELAINGQGIAILPNLLCRKDVEQARLERVLADHALPPLLVAGSFIGRKHMPRKVRAFLDFIAERLESDGHAPTPVSAPAPVSGCAGCG